MLSKYFEIKTKSNEFKEHIESLFSELQGKKILLYGAGQGFVTLNKKYEFTKKLDIVGIADLKFEKNTKGKFLGCKKVAPNKIKEEQFDVILITNEKSIGIEKFLVQKLRLRCPIQALFVEEIKDEQINLNYLYKYKFDKTLPKLIKTLKGQKIVLYGAGVFLELIKKYFDISELDVIAVTDRKFDEHKEIQSFLGWKTCRISEIEELKPDCVVVTTKNTLGIIHNLHTEELKNTKIRPLLKKSFFELLKEL